jgi:hypothetical protein
MLAFFTSGRVDDTMLFDTVMATPCWRHRAGDTVLATPCWRHRAGDTVLATPCRTTQACAARGRGRQRFVAAAAAVELAAEFDAGAACVDREKTVDALGGLAAAGAAASGN